MRVRFITLFMYFFAFLGIAQKKDTTITSLEKRFEKRKIQEFKIGTTKSRLYYQPRWHESVTNLPKDFIDTNIDFVSKDHSLYLAGAIAATALIIPGDEYLINKSRELGYEIGLNNNNEYGKFGPLENIPKNYGSGLYLIGNGTTVILLSVGFITQGLLNNDYRAYATASGLMESIALSGFYVQTIKRITGRESPFIARENGNPGGDWNPFPSFIAYAKQTPKYDAMPSGHLTTIMSAFTVITTNYPEFKWIKPLGYSLIGAMCFQMMQSEVHWASDYPLALLVGYFTGKTIAKNRYVEKTNGQTTLEKKYKLDFIGGNFYGYNTLGLQLKF